MADKDEVDPTEGSDAEATKPESGGAETAGPEPAAASPTSPDVGDLVPVGAPAGSTRRAKKESASVAGPTKKTKATPKRDAAPDKPHRTGPATFIRESVGELRKVVYPTGQQLVNYFVVVLIFVLFVIAYVSLLDLGFGAAMFRIFA